MHGRSLSECVLPEPVCTVTFHQKGRETEAWVIDSRVSIHSQIGWLKTAIVLLSVTVRGLGGAHWGSYAGFAWGPLSDALGDRVAWAQLGH